MTSHPDLNGLSFAQQREMLTKLLRQKAAQGKRYPMSIGQQGLWHAFRRDPQSTSFSVFLPTRMRAAVDITALQHSIQWLAARHVCLHTVFSDTGGELVQIVKSDLQPDFSIIDLPGASDDEARAVVAQEIMRPHDLEQGPLLRVRAVRLADNDWIILALTHHIVVDFWSLILILNELRIAYPRVARQERPQLPLAQNNYAQFVHDQQAFMASSRGAEQRDYWQKLVAQAAPVIELPNDYLRPPVFQNAATGHLLEFPDGLVPRINGLASRLKATPFSVVHAALQVFLGRYSGQQKFLIGSPFSGRAQQQYEQTVGFFINMLPLTANLEGDPTFAQLIVRTSEQLLGALEHEAYPIAQIMHDARLPRDPARSPLFQVSCTFEKSQVKAEAGRASFLFPKQQHVWDFGGLPQESFYVPHPTCHYDLEFVFEQTDATLRGMLVACRALFKSDTLAIMAKNFSQLLTALVDHAEVAISHTPWSPTVAEESTDSNQANNSSTADPARPADSRDVVQATVTGQIAAAANAHPQHVALQFADQKITYSELYQVADKIASQVHHQREQSSTAQLNPPHRSDACSSGGLSIVPVCTASGPLAFIGMLGVQLAVAVPAAIDLTQPAIDAASLLKDSAALVWLGDLAQPYARDLAPVVGIDLGQQLDQIVQARGSTSRRPSPAIPLSPTRSLLSAKPEDVAYLVYTSGSTGKPKGVLIEQAAVCNTLLWRKQAVPLSPADRVLMLLSHQFDAALGIAWSALTQGATLVWADDDRIRDPQRLIEQIVRDRITVLPAVPSLLRVLVAHPTFAHCHSLRLIFTGGEAMPPDLPSQMRQVTQARFWNFYGPSEAAIEATAGDVTEHSPLCPVPIGLPIRNTQILVLDPHQRPVPDTVPGELAIAGPGLARGYLNDPNLTARKFVRLPTEAKIQGVHLAAGTRMYLTGDRGRRLPDGQLEFLGRNDHQIKLRGYRIELGEIEAVLQSHPAVQRAAVKIVAAGTPQAQLVGYISLGLAFGSGTVPAGLHGANPTHFEMALLVKRFASEQLASYKVPAAIVVVDTMPLTSSGKVDRGRLPDSMQTAISAVDYLPPETALEKFIAAAWCTSLQVETVGINVNYFDAGGSSLGAAMLTNQLSQDLGIHVPTALLFDLADIGQVATRLAQLHGPALSERFGPQAISEQLARARRLGNADSGGGKGVANSVATHSGPMHPLLAPLKATGTLPPLFLVHPPGGIVICYRELAQNLATEQPLFAIRARGLHGPETLPKSLAAMAADYLQAVREVQPTGPYTLGGWSLGGLVAYEMAQQLLRSGQSLARLLMLDTTIPEGSTALVPAAELVNVGMEYGIELTLDQLGQLPPAEQLPFLWEHAKSLGVIDDQSPPEVVARILEDLRSLFHHHVELARGYRLEPLAGNIELFRPNQTPFAVQVSPDRGWRHLAHDVRVHYVPGHHHSMVQSPHVEHLARVINGWAGNS